MPKSGSRKTGQNQIASTGKSNDRMRIAKAMAHAGLCSRRDAERWIEDGRVKVNGKRIDSPALDIGPQDKVVVDDAPLPNAQPARLWRYHKPKGLMTTHRDPQERPTVFDNLPQDLPRVVSIGRLDVNTEGLLLLTTNGELARHLELPSTGWLRRYRVRVHGRLKQEQLDALKDGCMVDGVRYGPIDATLDSQKGANSWLTLGLREGKNREVRNIMQGLDVTVNRLIRISYGPFQLLDLKPGDAEPVKRRVLLDQLGTDIAAKFNFEDAPTTRTGAPRPQPNQQPNRRGTNRASIATANTSNDRTSTKQKLRANKRPSKWFGQRADKQAENQTRSEAKPSTRPSSSSQKSTTPKPSPRKPRRS